MTVVDRERLPARQMVTVDASEIHSAAIQLIEWQQPVHLLEWRQQAEVPDLMGMFRIVMKAHEDPESDEAEPMTNAEIDQFMEWLHSDSLDWEGMERRDAWRD